MGQKSHKIAFIYESQCIGCTQCLAVCPVDAIVGASSFLHTVVAKICIGCELCIPACPADCITLKNAPNGAAKKSRAIKLGIAARKARLKERQLKNLEYSSLKQAILEAVARAKAKKQAKKQIDV